MNSLKSIVKQRKLERNNLILNRNKLQHRQFLFVVVPVIGAGFAIILGGALTIYAMEKYRIYKQGVELQQKHTQDKMQPGVKGQGPELPTDCKDSTKNP
mmetsp:Transcript_47768/g.94569  ORF Transcript_47768/g.94569 Transcript_47768/m.94569 type:complete len:99 (-) Transcript_47768:261-557(-)